MEIKPTKPVFGRWPSHLKAHPTSPLPTQRQPAFHQVVPFETTQFDHFFSTPCRHLDFQPNLCLTRTFFRFKCSSYLFNKQPNGGHHRRSQHHAICFQTDEPCWVSPVHAIVGWRKHLTAPSKRRHRACPIERQRSGVARRGFPSRNHLLWFSKTATFRKPPKKHSEILNATQRRASPARTAPSNLPSDR